MTTISATNISESINIDVKAAIKIKKQERMLLCKLMFDNSEDGTSNTGSAVKEKELFDRVRISGTGRTGSSDYTRGKSCFARPCTVGWKSQNQPIQKKGGGRTPL